MDSNKKYKMCEYICDSYQNKEEKGYLTENEQTKLKKAMVALQAFLRPDKHSKKIQAANPAGMATSTDFARVERQTMNLFVEMDYVDMFWKEAFKEVPLAKGQDSWEIHNVDNGLTFERIPEGGRLKTVGLRGTKQTIYVSKYGAALQWTDEMLRWRKIPAMIDKMEIFRNKYFIHKSGVHYALLVAGVGGTTTYQGAGNTQISRDIQTVNSAAFTLGNRLKDKGYSGNVMLLYMPESMRDRISRATNVSSQQVVIPGATQDGSILDRLTYRATPRFTFDSNIQTTDDATTGYLVHPGNKIQRADQLAPTSYSDFDILSLVTIQAVWSYYGAAIGDTDQIQRVRFA